MYIDLDFEKRDEDNYMVTVAIELDNDKFGTRHATVPMLFNREELKQMRNMVRNMVHNLLLDLNKELNWES